MTNMRRGFTMIELIFVIVIIGILAAVAIPKLAATRDDAKISNIVANARTLSGDVTSYYTSQGAAKWTGTGGLDAATVGDVTNVPLYTTSGCGTAATADETIIGTGGANKVYYACDETGGADCLAFEINGTDMTIYGGSGGTPICDGVLADPAIIGMSGGVDANKTTQLGGVGVRR